MVSDQQHWDRFYGGGEGDDRLSWYQDRPGRSLAMIESTAIYCFVVAMILIFANPFWNQAMATANQAAGG